VQSLGALGTATMHPISFDELVEKLTQMREFGNSTMMLFVTVRTTSDGLLAGLNEGRALELQYPRAGIFDFVRVLRFVRFCRRKGLSWQKYRWGRERVYAADVGYDPARAANLFDSCFGSIFGHYGPFAVRLHGIGLLVPGSSFRRAALPPLN